VHLNENFLVRHEVSESLRARMIDWMVEVLTNFKCEDETFFISVAIMDSYMSKCR